MLSTQELVRVKTALKNLAINNLPETPTQIFIALCQKLDVTPEDLRIKCRYPEHLTLRNIAWDFLSEQKWGYSQIARAFGCQPSTVSHYFRKKTKNYAHR